MCCVLIVAAKYLKAHESELAGTVKLLFQPAEEGGGGAKLMVQEGALQGVSAVFGLHVWPTAPSGHIQTRVCPSPSASSAPHHLQQHNHMSNGVDIELAGCCSQAAVPASCCPPGGDIDGRH